MSMPIFFPTIAISVPFDVAQLFMTLISYFPMQEFLIDVVIHDYCFHRRVVVFFVFRFLL